MGSLTYTQIETEVRSALGGRTDLDDRLTVIINLSQMRMARMKRWEELEAIYTNSIGNTGDLTTDKEVALSANFRDMYTLRVIDGDNTQKLVFYPYRVWDQQIPYPEKLARNRPKIYTLWRKTIELYPIPDQTYTLWARAIFWPTDFTGTSVPTQKSDFDQKDDAIIALSISYAFSSLKKYEDAGKWFAIFANMMRNSISEEFEWPDIDLGPNPGVGGSTGNVIPSHLDPFSKTG